MASTKITRTSAISSEKKLTISTWIKRSYIGEEALIGNTATGSNWAMFYFDGGNRLQFASYINSSYVVRVQTNRVFNDVGAWYHLQATLDVSLSTPEAKIYVNGEEQTDLAQNVQPSQNADTGWFYDWNFEVGVMFGSSYYLNGCLADTYYIQGYVYPPSTFGETDATTGEWKPILNPTINYGGNGGNSCNLKFENSANMDLDSGDNNLTFTTSGTLTQTKDTPSNNFATLNRLYQQTTGEGVVLLNGNTRCYYNPDSSRSAFGTIAVGTGKYYYEAQVDTAGTGPVVGVVDLAWSGINGAAGAFHDNALNFGYSSSGVKTSGGVNTAYGDTFTAGDIIGVAIDKTNNKLYFAKNGVWQNSGDPTSGATGTGSAFNLASDTLYTAACRMRNGGDWKFNFGNGYFGTTAITSEGTNASGNGKFEYDVPTGYTALSTKGLNE